VDSVISLVTLKNFQVFPCVFANASNTQELLVIFNLRLLYVLSVHYCYVAMSCVMEQVSWLVWGGDQRLAVPAKWRL